MPPPGHRKRVKRFHEAGHAHELTFSCYERRPLMLEPEACPLFAKGMEANIRRMGFYLLAFVFMPEHIHLLVWSPLEDVETGDLLSAIKRPHSYRMKKTLQERRSELVTTLTIQERPGKMVFRFWQEGGGYDRNMVSQDAIDSAIEYIHANPVRRGLCDHPGDWLWSSWHHYYGQPGDHLPTVHGMPAE